MKAFSKLVLTMAIGLSVISSGAEAAGPADPVRAAAEQMVIVKNNTGLSPKEIRKEFDPTKITSPEIVRIMEAVNEAGRNVHGKDALDKTENNARATLERMGMTKKVDLKVMHALPDSMTENGDSSSVSMEKGRCVMRLRMGYVGNGVFAESSEASRLSKKDFKSISESQAQEGVSDTVRHEAWHCRVAEGGGTKNIVRIPAAWGVDGKIIESAARKHAERMEGASWPPQSEAERADTSSLEEGYADVGGIMIEMGESPGVTERSEALGRLKKLLEWRVEGDRDHRSAEAIKLTIERFNDLADLPLSKRDEMVKEIVTVGWLRGQMLDAKREAKERGGDALGILGFRIGGSPSYVTKQLEKAQDVEKDFSSYGSAGWQWREAGMETKEARELGGRIEKMLSERQGVVTPPSNQVQPRGGATGGR